jgi:(E)-4-hydroxy-3-methylbut-2-enyl-diphosphate synthase
MSVLLIYADIVNPVTLRLSAAPTASTARAILRGDRRPRTARPAPAVLAPRRKTRQIKVGQVLVGGDAPVSVQSMTTTLTADVNATLQQIAELTAAGCDIVRVACPSQDDADALPQIASKSQIPVIADIHFQPKYVFAAIDAGCAAVRVNPGNIRKFDDQVKEIARAAKDAGVSIRIGGQRRLARPAALAKYGKATPEALVESAVWEASLFEEHDFHDFKISVKHNDPVVMVAAYEMLAERGDWPLHLGVTEAGPAFQGTIKSLVAFGALLSKGIGDTIRVSLSAPAGRGGQGRHPDPAVAQPAAAQARDRLLPVLRPRPGRRLQARRRGHRRPRRARGAAARRRHGLRRQRPGEAREADLGVASGNGKGRSSSRARSSRPSRSRRSSRPSSRKAMRLAEGLPEGSPVVTVS